MISRGRADTDCGHPAEQHKETQRWAQKSEAGQRPQAGGRGGGGWEARKIWWADNNIVIFAQGETRDRRPGPGTWSQTPGRSPAARRPGGGRRRPSWRGSCPPSRARRPHRGRARVRGAPRPRRTLCRRWGQRSYIWMIMFVNSGWECSDKANGFSTKRFVAPCLICKYKSWRWHLQHN